MAREDQYRVTVAIDNVDLGVFDKLSGGEIDSEETKYKPGGMAPQVSLGGSVSVNNVTVSRLYDLQRDHQILPMLISKVGKGSVTVTKQPLDPDGNVYGKPTVYTGRLKQVTPPDHDSTGSGAAMVELEVSTVGTVA